MPYITEDRRALYHKKGLDALLVQLEETEDSKLDGDLNYLITTLVAEGMLHTGIWNYQRIARAVAVFECAKLEFYRRIAGIYEDKKANLNDLHEYFNPHFG